ncbi:putative ADP-ribosylation factor GTPase-activating protein AGD9 [Capsicum chinense]|nr:putative ADP-ribosylation factor GTPase-activating protein AGD9 [Capsicum chinense]
MMYFGGNNRAQVFLKQHGWTDGGKIEANITCCSQAVQTTNRFSNIKTSEAPKETSSFKDETPEISASPKASQSAFTTSIKKPIVAKKSGKPGGLGARKLTKKGSSAISSADLFGNDNRSDLHLSASDLINRISFQAQQDMSYRKNIAGETGKRLGSFASTLIADFQY